MTHFLIYLYLLELLAWLNSNLTRWHILYTLYLSYQMYVYFIFCFLLVDHCYYCTLFSTVSLEIKHIFFSSDYPRNDSMNYSSMSNDEQYFTLLLNNKRTFNHLTVCLAKLNYRLFLSYILFNL